MPWPVLRSPVEGHTLGRRVRRRSLFSDTFNRPGRDRRLAAVPDARDLADDFDLKRLPDSFYDDPYPTYRALREHAPVKRLADGGVFLSRYADVVAVYKDTATFSSDKHEEFLPKYGASPLFEHHTTS